MYCREQYPLTAIKVHFPPDHREEYLSYLTN